MRGRAHTYIRLSMEPGRPRAVLLLSIAWLRAGLTLPRRVVSTILRLRISRLPPDGLSEEDRNRSGSA